jgi:hypothetical protein
MDREQIQRDGEKAVLTAWDRALTRPSETAVDTVQARLAVVAAQAPLLAAIDDLEVVCAAWRRAASLAANDAADRKAAIDRVLALHTVVHVDVLGDRCREDWKPWPCETVRAAADG